MFGVIVADPPWKFSDSLGARGADANYGTLGLGEISALRVEAVAAEDAVLLLWCPAALRISTAEAVAAAWGFDPKQLWTWVKTRKSVSGDSDPGDESELAFGMGRLARNACEYAVVATRGKVQQHLEDRSTRNVFFAPLRAHSEKPEKVQDALDRMFPKLRKLELFGRRSRSGWVVVGDQAPATEGQDIRDTLAFLGQKADALRASSAAG